MSHTLPTTDILIVGAGPTGLTLAHELLRHGIKPRLIEKTPIPSPNTKALGVMARTWTSFLIGCDGAHSTVRHLLGAPFVGTTVEQSFTTGNVRMHWDLPPDQALAYLNRGRLTTYFPLPDGHHRFIIAYQPGEAPQGEVTLDEIQRAIDTCGPKGSRASDPGFLARYHVHQRKVDHYVNQRVILVGDAAHIHSPLGAQGMNTGMQDAMNLAWKLALVVQVRAPARLLESYQIERSEVGKRLLQDDELLTRQAFMHHPLATATRDRVAPCLTQLPQTQQFITTTAAELNISYHHWPLVAEYRDEKVESASSRVSVGDRAPDGPISPGKRAVPRQLYDLLTGIRHALLIFTQKLDQTRSREVQFQLSDWWDLLDVYPILRQDPDGEGEKTLYDPDGVLAEHYGIVEEGLVLIRPDGYISFRSQPIAGEPLQRYLHTHFSLQHAL